MPVVLACSTKKKARREKTKPKTKPKTKDIGKHKKSSNINPCQWAISVVSWQTAHAAQTDNKDKKKSTKNG